MASLKNNHATHNDENQANPTTRCAANICLQEQAFEIINDILAC